MMRLTGDGEDLSRQAGQQPDRLELFAPPGLEVECRLEEMMAWRSSARWGGSDAGLPPEVTGNRVRCAQFLLTIGQAGSASTVPRPTIADEDGARLWSGLCSLSGLLQYDL